jgi:hypothetical protein
VFITAADAPDGRRRALHLESDGLDAFALGHSQYHASPLDLKPQQGPATRDLMKKRDIVTGERKASRFSASHN